MDRSIGELARFVIIALGCAIFGASTGLWLLGLALSLATYLAWVFIQQARFDRWLSLGRRGTPPTSFGIWGNISDDFYRMQRRHRREKQKLHALLRRVQDSTGALREGIVALENGDDLSWWNPAAARLLNLQPGDEGQALTNFVREPAFVDYLHGAQRDEPLTMRAPGNEERFLQVEVTRFGNNEALVVVRDTTRLFRLEQMRQDFVANVSHELLTPLTVVSGYLETLEASGQAPEKWARPIEQMQQQAERMAALVQDLLVLSKLETSDQQRGSEEVDVGPLVAAVANETRALSNGRHTVVVECSDECVIAGSSKELHSAFANLASNAVRYSPDGGTITLRWWRDIRGGHFSVRDQGLGIAAVHFPRLTERFYRVDSGRDRATGGTGLGLAIVKHVMVRHGGALDIESAPGRGSNFTLHFPPERLSAASAA